MEYKTIGVATIYLSFLTFNMAGLEIIVLMVFNLVRCRTSFFLNLWNCNFLTLWLSLLQYLSEFNLILTYFSWIWVSWELLKFGWLLLRPHPPRSPQLGLVAGSAGAGVNTSVWSWTASRWGRTRPGTAWGWRGSWSTVMECSLGALTIQGLLPGRVRGRHPTVILGVRGAHHKAE